MTTVASQNNILLGQENTTKLSAQDLVKELQTIRNVLEKAENTNGKVLKQIQSRAKEWSMFEETSPTIADMRSKARRLGEVMDGGDTRLNELEKMVNVVCCKVDDVINVIHKAEKVEEHRNEGQGQITAGSKDIERSGKTRDEIIHSGPDIKVKRLTTAQPVHVQQPMNTERKVKSGARKEQTPDPVDDLPSIVCTSGFKRRLTVDSSDNRLKTDKIAKQKQMESKRPNIAGAKSDLDPAYVNIKNTSVRIKEQDARFEADFKNMPGLSPDILDGQGSDTMLAGLVWQQWHSYAEKEKNKDSQRHIVRAKGPDVVLCLDTSQSMEGAPFEEMMSFAMKYVEGVEQWASMIDLHENISVTTFGYITKVWHHLTSDYDAVKATLREIWSLIPRGRSPIAGGLLMALAGCLGNAGAIIVGNIPVHARIILVSDGKGTPDHIKTGPELVRTQDEDMRSSLRVDGILQHVSQNLEKRKIMVCCVPVGNANTKTLEEISKITGGKVFGPLKRDQLVKWSKLTIIAVDLYKKTVDLTKVKGHGQIKFVPPLSKEDQGGNSQTMTSVQDTNDCMAE
ncbi:hypothetical protein KP79_PYT14818 [Mizuhopecten yessoensis]|uniref:VWFA domain-containing protein n=1 Tax=Mizuhopecten yessoensis TaxID=6573 RepID=A0A210Q1J3_MIZYE|nr:hypothetical protein KP79_PYT14818 [Mizuhopecten yessoensis]